jgi:hypothetical protein
MVGQRQKASRRAVRRWPDIGNMRPIGRGRRWNGKAGRNAAGAMGLARALLFPAVSTATGGDRSHDRGEQR